MTRPTADARANGAPVPVVTLAVALLTAAISALALAQPPLLHLLQRHPTASDPWTSWRLLTSLLVHVGWTVLALNLVGLIVVGAAVERRLGAAWWIALYLVGGVVGEIAGVRWQPVGAGNSVATFGLVGGLLASLSGDASVPATTAASYAVAWVILYTGLTLGGPPVALVACVLCAPLGALIVRTRARRAAPRGLGAALAGAALVTALLLCARHDIHGPPLLAGAMVGALRRQRRPDAG